MKSAFFGQYLLTKGIITAPQLAKSLALQEVMNKKTGDLAVERNLLTKEDVKKILNLQKKEDIYFGEAAIRLKLLSKEQLDTLLSSQKTRHVFIGDAVVKLGYLTVQERDKALTDYIEEQNEDASVITPYTADQSLSAERPYIEKFTLYTCKVFQRMCGIVAKYDRYEETKKEFLADSVSVYIDCNKHGSAGFIRYMLLMCEEMSKIVSAKIHTREELPPGQISDEQIISELVNIVCGLSCNSLQSFAELSPSVPTIIPRNQAQIFGANDTAVIVSLISPYGQLQFALIFVK